MARTEKSLQRSIEENPPDPRRVLEERERARFGRDLNQALERAGRVADFLEFAELLCTDALHRNESCGGHFREEYQCPDGEAKRNDQNFMYVAAWEQWRSRQSADAAQGTARV